MNGRMAGILVLVAAVAGCATAGVAGSGGSPEIGRPPATPDAPPPATDPDARPPAEFPFPLEGGCGLASRDLRPRYILPFTVGSSYELMQGNCGPHSHAGRFNFSFDFRMPMRTPIIATRDGVVSTVRESNADGTDRVGDENYVIIDHGDGEYSRYIHLTRDGAFVSKGDRVARGDTIALSGDSGRSAFPHLHFDVVDGCSDGVCWTIPAAFLNSDPPIPTVRRLYVARPFPF